MSATRIVDAEIRFSTRDASPALGPTANAVEGVLIAGGLLGAGGLRDPRLSPRERTCACVAPAACIAIGGIAHLRPEGLRGPVWDHPRRTAALAMSLAAVSSGFGGGHRSPAYFPSLILAAFGAIVDDPAQAVPAGIAVAGIHFTGSLLSILSVREPNPREEAGKSLAQSIGFVGATVTGSLINQFATRSRNLNEFLSRRRDTERHRRITERALEVERIAERFETLLLASERLVSADSVGRARARLQTALAQVRTAKQRPRLQERNLSTHRRVRASIDEFTRATDLDVSLRWWTLRRRISAYQTGAILDTLQVLLQNSANARRGRSDPVNVRVVVRVRRRSGVPWLELTVEDDASGPAPSPERFGTGLESCRLTARLLRGEFPPLAMGRHGVVATLRFPLDEARTRGRRIITVSRQFEVSRERAFQWLRLVTLAQGAALYGSRRSFRQGLAQLAMFGLCGWGVEWLPPGPRTAVRSGLTVSAMGVCAGPGRPPTGGFSGLMAAELAADEWGTLALISALNALGVATWRAGPERFRSGLEATLGDRTFAVVCAFGGRALAEARREVLRVESDFGHEAERRLAEALLRHGLLKHNLLAPLRNAMLEVDGDAWDAFCGSPIGRELLACEGDLERAGVNLAHALGVGDGELELARQIAWQFDIPVRVTGEAPRSSISRDSRLAAEARLALVPLGQSVAAILERSLHEFGGRRQLHAVELRLVPDHQSPDFTWIEIVQRADRSSRREFDLALLDDAARAAGGRAEKRQSNWAVLVPNLALM